MTGATFSLDGIEAVFLDLDGALYLGSLTWTFAAFVLLATQSAFFAPVEWTNQ